MADKTINTRIIQKHDTTANWNKATNFIPKLGELILYTDVNKIKMGDGTTKVTQLPFLSDEDTTDLTQMTGTLPLSKGGAGRNFLISNNVNGILRAPEVLDDDHGLLITRTNNGAMYATEQDGTPQFGTLPVAQGGTGATDASAARTNLGITKANLGLGNVENKSSATIRGELTKTNVTTALGYTPPEQDTIALNSMTGLLPLAHGGTGTTFSSASHGDIVYYSKANEDSTPQLWAKSKLDIEHGGTGATDAATARTNLGITKANLDITDTDENVKVTTGNSGTGAVTYYLTSINSSSDTYTGNLRKHASANLYVSADSNETGAISLRLGNTTKTNTAGSKYGYIRLYGTGINYVDIKPGAQSGDHTITIPDAEGTMALRSIIKYGTSAPSSTTGDVGDIYIRYTA